MSNTVAAFWHSKYGLPTTYQDAMKLHDAFWYQEDKTAQTTQATTTQTNTQLTISNYQVLPNLADGSITINVLPRTDDELETITDDIQDQQSDAWLKQLEAQANANWEVADFTNTNKLS